MFFALLGLMVGSFLNVVVLRFGFSERPAVRSHCAQCSTQLTVLDLVPVLSYIVLGGRCRHCGSAIRVQYPLVELAVGLLFAGTYVVYPPGADIASTIQFLAALGFWASLVGLVVYDIRHTLIPTPFVYALFGFAAVNVLGTMFQYALLVPLIDAMLGGVVCGGFFALITLVTRGRGMGIGDAYVAGAIGLFLGLEGGAIACAFGVWIGAAVGVLALLAQHVFPRTRLLVAGMRVTLKSELPFAPFLALGALIVYFTQTTPFFSFGLGSLL